MIGAKPTAASPADLGAKVTGTGDGSRRSGDEPPSQRAFDRGLGLLFLLCALGLVIGVALNFVDESLFFRSKWSLTLYFYRNQDTIWFALALVAAPFLLWVARSRRGRVIDSLWPSPSGKFDPALVLAGICLIVVAAGTYVVYHGYALSLDEFMAEFQATIFLEGRLLAKVPAEWADFVVPLQPIFIYHDQVQDFWGAHYRPVAAAIRALFSLLSLGLLTNAVLTAVSVALVAAIARRLWPENNEAPFVAALLLLSSPQVLITGMTAYAMPAHLCLNLAWLWLFLRDDRLGHVLAALVGVAAVGLHQVHNHALFVMPFMLALLFSARWRLALGYAAVYAVAHLTWIFWHDIAVAVTVGGAAANSGAVGGVDYLANAISFASVPNLFDLGIVTVNLLRLVAWQNLILVPLVIVALRPGSTVPPLVRQLAWGLLLSMIPYVLVISIQIHGWGYRYLHGLLGSLALIATYGWVRISAANRSAAGSAWCRRTIVLFTALMIVVGVPLRAFQVEAFVRPYAAATSFVESLSDDIALIDDPEIWFGGDLARNDPFLRNRPKVMVLQLLTPAQLRGLCERYSVRLVTADDLEGLGVKRSRRDMHRALAIGSGQHRSRVAGPTEADALAHDEALRAVLEGPECQG